VVVIGSHPFVGDQASMARLHVIADGSWSTPVPAYCARAAGKKVEGRKQNLVVDTMGLVIGLTVTAASVQDRDAAATVVAQACAKAPGIAASTRLIVYGLENPGFLDLNSKGAND
jgi:hypothetical protein